MEIFGLGAPELILILIVFLLFFGKDKLPSLARSIGTSFKELKAGFSDTIHDSKSSEKKEEKDKNDAGKARG